MKSQTAYEYQVRDAYLRTFAILHTEPLCGPAELLSNLEALGVGLDDVERVLRLAHEATRNRLPDGLGNASRHYRFAVTWPDHRTRSSGTVLGEYNGYVFLAWTT